MKYQIAGQPFPYVLINMDEGEVINCEAGGMSWRSEFFEMDTSAGGIGKAFSRTFSGESMFINSYTATRSNQEIAISSKFIGTIIPIEISGGKSIVVQKKAILAYTNGIDRKIAFKSPMKGLFGGEGFIMQEVFGEGLLFLEVDGEMKEYNLDMGEKMILSSGFLLMMDNTCTMDVESVGGIKNTLFGGEGIFNTTITGPGKVIVQTSPILNLANSLRPYLPTSSN